MANTVEIVIRVDNAQANAALGTTVQALKSAGIAGQASFGQLSQASGVSVAALQNVGNAGKTMGGHMTTSLDGVRLLSQELGLRLPRALEAMLSRMPAVTAAISGMMGAFAGIAIAEVFYRAGEAVYNLYNKYISLTAAADKYNETVAKRRDEAFTDTHSIEVTTQRIDEATHAAERFKAAGEAIHNGAWKDIFSGDAARFGAGVTSLITGRGLTDQGYKAQGQVDTLTPKQVDQEHEIAVLRINQAHAMDDSLRGQQKLNAEAQKQIELHKENQNYSRQRDSALQPFGVKDGGKQQRDIEDQISAGELAAKKINLQREIRDRTIQMQDEATNAGLRDGALQLAQKLEAEATIRRSATGTQAQIDAVEAKYTNEQKQRIEELTEATKKLAAESARAGLSGVPQIAGDLTAKLAEIEDARHKFIDGAGLDPNQTRAANNQFDSQRGSANAAAMQKRRTLDEEYTDSVRAQVAQRVEAEMFGFERIEAARAAEKQKADREYAKNYIRTAQDGTETDLGSDDNHTARAQLDAAIDRASNAERLKLTEQVQQQTLQMTTEAAAAERRVRASGISGWVGDYRAGVVEVQAAEQQMLSKIQHEQAKTGRNPETDAMYNQQRVAAVQKADAQIEQLNQGMAKQIASTLQGAFDDPVHYIQRRMTQMFTEILANWIMQSKMFSSTFGGLIGGAHITQGGTRTGINAGTIGAGSGIPGITSSTTNTGTSVGSEQDSSGTVDQAMVAPGYSGTASYVGGGALSNSMAMAGPIGQMGLDIARRNAGVAPTSSASAGINDGTIGSEQDASSVDSTGMTVAQAQAQGGVGAGSGMQNAIGGVIGAGVGAYVGTKGIIGAFESGKASGILTGAESGAAMGASIGMLAGPLGAAIGGGIGAVGGATAGLVGWASGEGNRLQSKKYFKDTMRPQMEGVENTYMRGGGGDAMSAVSQVESIATQGFNYMATKFGMSAALWAKAAYIDKERNSVESQITRLASAGRDYTSKSAAQFHSGGTISDFGDFATSPTEGWVHALLGEKMVTPSAASAHGPTIDMMNAGASPSDIAGHYLKNSGTLQPGGTTNHYHSYEGHTIKTLDGADFYDYLTKRGGADAIARAGNKRANQYAGDAA